MSTLKERVEQFNTMSLPGQPLGMHMGTSYLVNDLWRSHDDLLSASVEYIAALQAIADATGDDTANMVRCGDAEKALRAAIARATGVA